MTIKHLKPVLVTWRDITSREGWHDPIALEDFIGDTKEATVYQVGFLYEDDGDEVVLIDSYFAGKDLYGTITKIPKGCVIEIKELL